MSPRLRVPRHLAPLALLASLSAAACGDNGAPLIVEVPDAGPTSYAVLVETEGLAGAGLTVRLGAESLPIERDGVTPFRTLVVDGAPYEVTVATQPASPSQQCIVTGGRGVIAAAPARVAVRCASAFYPVGGVVEGLAGRGLVLALGGEQLPVAGNGRFGFATPLPDLASYEVGIVTQPTAPRQTCTVAHGTGQIRGRGVDDVSVVCTTETYPVGGTVTGLAGRGLTLQLEGGASLRVDADGAFTFPGALADGSAYRVRVETSPVAPRQTCEVARGEGIIDGAAVTDVAVTCGTETYTVGGTVTGLAGRDFALRLNGGAPLPIAADGAFAFPARLADGAAYEVTVASAPVGPRQSCVVARGTGAIDGASVGHVAVSCHTDSFAVGGVVRGLAGRGLVLRNNGGDPLTVTADGAFTFRASLLDLSSYDVTVGVQPSGPAQTCAVAGGAGRLAGAPVTDIVVTCATETYPVGGSVTGLAGTGFTLRLNGGTALPIPANGRFVFPSRLPDGSRYEVTVGDSPTAPSQACAVERGTGTIAGAAVTYIVVTCATETYTVGGSVTGLAGTGFTLRLNGGTALPMPANGRFVFPSRLPDGSRYEVTVGDSPTAPSQACAVANATGTISRGDVVDVAVTCTTRRFAVGGTVSGLQGEGLTLRLDGGAALLIGADGRFVFPAQLLDGSRYEVTVGESPSLPSQTCAVGNATGTVAGADVTNVAVTCTINRFTVGGTVTGLEGTGFTLRLNGGPATPIRASGRFVFPAQLSDGARYHVLVVTAPSAPSQTCTIADDSGTIAGASVDNVAVTCTTNRFTVGGTVRGLTGRGLVLRNNGGDDLAITANGAFTFATELADLSRYEVTVATAPSHPRQTCVVTGGTGRLAGAANRNVQVVCTTEDRYTVTATITGLVGTGLSLRLNGSPWPVAAGTERFVFPNAVLDGGTYEVTVAASPRTPSQTCVVGNGTGTIDGAPVTDVTVTCTARRLTIGGSVRNLTGGSLVLRNNAGDDLTITRNGTFTFATALEDLSPYAVTVAQQPTGPRQTCTVTGGTGRLNGSPITHVEIVCLADRYALGGTVEGLVGSVFVRVNSDDWTWLQITRDGPFTFPGGFPDGTRYDVLVVVQPQQPNQTCVVGNGTGTIDGEAVNHLTITCTTNGYVVGGVLSGLAGRGLRMRISAGGAVAEEIDVTADGTFQFAPLPDFTHFNVTVAQQPTGPRQVCTVTNGSGQLRGFNTFNASVRCVTERYTVSATVSGLVGEGLYLTLNGAWQHRYADGPFTFQETVPDQARYTVAVGVRPTEPSQTCVIENGTGTISGPVTDVVVRCTVDRFTIGGAVRGLTGRGLRLRNNDGQEIAIAADGPFAFPTSLLDLTPYAVSISAYPTDPDQVCQIRGGIGALHGADVRDIDVVCGTLGHLLITEVASCPEPGASCWFEVNNRGVLAEDLSMYALRSRAVDPVSGVAVDERRFDLPALIIPSGGYVLVRGRVSDDNIDGPSVAHVVDDGEVPSWGSSGFLELLSEGRTMDFVRWGQSAVEPTTPGAWVGPPARALPPQGVYGHVIARYIGLNDEDIAEDWASWAFGTPGGRNDLTVDADNDRDGIPDQAEMPGRTFAGIDLYAMGARPRRRDIFIQIDRMESTDPALIPQEAALSHIREVFAAHDIAVHFDAGDLFSSSFDPRAFNLGGGNVVPFATAVSMGASSDGQANFYAYKAGHMDVRLTPIFHYLLFGSTQRDGSSGAAELEGNDILITLGGAGLTDRTIAERNKLINFQSGAMMHELGHNLGLDHGGDTDENFKPNYLSVMNSMYQLYGLPVLGSRDGDRYYYVQHHTSPDEATRRRCGTVMQVETLQDLENGPYSHYTEFGLDYSSGSRAALDEHALNEYVGLGGTPAARVDYDCDGQLEQSSAFDTNGGLHRSDPGNGSGMSVLSDHDDWGNLAFVFVRAPAGQSVAPISLLPRTVDPLADDRQPTVVEAPLPR